MSGTAKEVAHRVVGGAAGGVFGQAYGMTVGLKPRAMAGTELGDMTVVAVVGRLGSDGLLYYPALEEASGQGVGAHFQHAPEDEGRHL